MSTPPAPPPAPTLDVDPPVGTSLGITGSTAAVPPAALVAGVRARGSGVDPEARPRPRSPPPRAGGDIEAAPPVAGANTAAARPVPPALRWLHPTAARTERQAVA